MNFNKIKAEGRQETKSIIKTIFRYSNILGLLSIIVTVWVFYLSEKKKELTFSIDSFISLVDKNSLSGSGIKVTFDSVPINNLYKVNCSLINTGNAAVTKNDIVESIVISFDPFATLLKYEITQTPKTIKVNDKVSNNTILITPDLLNPKDGIFLTIYYAVNKTSVLPSINSRIIDGNILMANKFNEKNKRNKFLLPLPSQIEKILFWITLVWNILFFLLISLMLFLQNSNKNGFWSNLFGFTIIVSGCILTILYLIANEII